MKLKIYKSDLNLRNESNPNTWTIDELLIQMKARYINNLLTFIR
jgi:hypothetical protein